MIDPNKPLDLATMTPDELFEVLNLTDMDDRERCEFLDGMSAWSRQVIPGPNAWWLQAILTANIWRRAHQLHVDQLIADALGGDR